MGKVFKYILVLSILVLLSACKSSKTIAEGEANFDLNTRQLVKAHKKATPNFRTFQSRVKINYKNGSDEQSHTVTLRIEKDKTIWLNATLNLVRAIITPERVSFYNKLDDTYFDGDFRYLSNLLGTELDFNKLQNLLIGNAIYDINSTDYLLSQHENSYLLQPEKQQSLFEIFFLINPSHFKMDSQQVAQTLESRMMEADYLSYQKVEKQLFPERMKVIALEQSSETIILLEYKSISLNENLRFPYKIPSGFDEIELK